MCTREFRSEQEMRTFMTYLDSYNQEYDILGSYRTGKYYVWFNIDSLNKAIDSRKKES